MGLDVEDTTGALEALSKVGITGAEAGTALRNVLLSLNTKMGVDLNVTSLSDALKALQPELENTEALTQIFGRESVTAAIGLIQNADAVEELTNKVTGTNVAQEQAAIRTETTAHKMEVLRAKVDDLKIGIADSLGGFSAYAGVISENATNIAAMMMIVTTMTGALPKLVNVLKIVTQTTVAQKAATVAVKVATEAWAVVQKLLNSVLTMNPLGIVITAIAALVAAIKIAYDHCDKFREICDKVWSAVKKVASVVWDSLVTAFEAVTGAIKTAWEWLKKFLGIKGKTVEVDVDVKGTDAEVLGPPSPIKKKTVNPVVDPDPDADKLGKVIDAYQKSVERAVDVNRTFGDSADEMGVRLDAMKSGITSIINQYGAESQSVQSLVKDYYTLARSRSESFGALQKMDAAKLTGKAESQSISGLSGSRSGQSMIPSVDKVTAATSSLGGLSEMFSNLSGAVDESTASILNWISGLLSSIGKAIPAILSLIPTKY